MKRFVLLFCLFIISQGCSRDSDESDFNPNDLDGDGVTNEIEIVDGTNPEDPCSVVIGHIYYPNLSQAWKFLDCDGDGVTNWDEIEGGTDLFDFCNLILNQQTLNPSNDFLQYDCDNDGVSNGQEIEDLTDINDRCSLDLSHQNLDLNIPAHIYWLSHDCDNDGRDNENEIFYGTNPFDPNDFSGAGSTLKKILQFTDSGSQEGSLFRTYFFDENDRFDKIIDFNNQVVLDFNYDLQGNLINVLTNEFSITYLYTNGNISQMTKQSNSGEVITQVVYDGNDIYTYDGSELDGLHSKKYTFDPMEGKLIEDGYFYINNSGNIRYFLTTYTYDTNYENLLISSGIKYGYNSDTEQLFDVDIIESATYTINYSYSDQALNPIYNALLPYYLNYLLAPEILRDGWISGDPGSHAHFSKNYLTGYGWQSSTFSGNLSHYYGYSYNHVQDNHYPIAGGFGDFNLQYDYEFYYE